jgi:PKD repeat protein
MKQVFILSTLCLIGLLLIPCTAVGQTPVSFTVAPEACREERLLFQNSSSASWSRFEWDFCLGDISGAATSTVVTTLPTAGPYADLDLVTDGTQWFAFATQRDNYSIYRLDFPNGITSPPVTTRILYEGILARIEGIKIISYNGQWYGFVLSASANKVLRLDFGTSLKNIPAIVDLGFSGSQLQYPADIEVMADNGSYVMIITNYLNKKLSLVNLGASPANSPDIAGMINFTSNDFAGLYGISVVKNSGGWYGLVTSFDNSKVFELEFTDNLFSLPSITGNLAVSQPVKVKLLREGSTGVAVINEFGGNIKRVIYSSNSEFGSIDAVEAMISNPSSIQAHDLEKVKGKWKMFFIDSTVKFARLDFSASCGYVSEAFSLAVSPEMTYSDDGTYEVELRGFGDNIESAVSQQITIKPFTAPDLEISASDHRCSGSQIEFASATSATGTEITWDLGNGVVEDEAIFSYAFTDPGTYDVLATITDSQNCSNTDYLTVKIFDPPAPDFTIPANPICTNNAFEFANLTSDNFEGLLSYQWLINDAPQNTDRDLHYTFTTPGNYKVKLLTSIPGCTTQKEVVISNVMGGPVSDFELVGRCESQKVTFSNLSSGSIAQYLWTLNATPVGSDTNIDTVLSAATYTAVLATTGTNGCVSYSEETFTIHPTPVPAFENLSSLTCTGQEIMFRDLTPNPASGSLTNFKWAFGDGGIVESLRNVSHVFATNGSFDVSLSVTNNHGCTATTKKGVLVNKSPTANFTSTNACLSTPVQFVAVDSNIKSWLWIVNEKTYQVASPSHTFRKPGPFDVFLKVVADNGCEASRHSTVVVPDKLTPDFSIVKNCVGETATLSDITSGSDPVALRSWKMDDGTLLTGEVATYSWQSPGMKQIELTVTAVSGCSYSISKSIEIVPMPQPSFTARPEIGTPPAEIAFENNSEYASSYTWKFGDGHESNEAEPVHTFIEEGDFEVSLIAVNEQNCQATSIGNVLISKPEPDVNIVGLTATDNPDGTIQILVVIANEGNTVVENLPVDIDISGNLSLKEIVREPIPPQSRFNLVLSYGLKRSDELRFLCAETSLDNDGNLTENKRCIEFTNKFLVLPSFPNPTKDFLNVAWIGKENETVTLTLINSSGTVVRKYFIDSIDGFNHKTIDVEGLQEGIFLLVVDGNNTRVAQRIVLAP